ncbi:MAG: hypothetical protein ABI644_12920, partial [Arenimonas sp.]
MRDATHGRRLKHGMALRPLWVITMAAFAWSAAKADAELAVWVAPPATFLRLTQQMKGANTHAEIELAWSDISSTFRREPITKELCWRPQALGIYVGWTNTLTQYWFGPVKGGRSASELLAEADIILSKLTRIYPKGDYQNAFTGAADAQEGDCLPIGPAQRSNKSAQEALRRALYATARQDLSAAEKCR